MSEWIKINPLPEHENIKCEILLKTGEIIKLCTYDYAEREFMEIKDGCYYFYSLEMIDSWREKE